MKIMIEKLKKIGLTDGESRVYLAMLKTGPSTVGPLVKLSGVAYSKIYEILQRLSKKGLSTHILKQKTKYFQVTNPENLNEFLEEKQTDLDNQKKFLESMLPGIARISKDISQEAEIFTGMKGLRTAYEVMLEDVEKKEEFLFFLTLPKEKQKEIGDFYKKMGKRFKKSGVDLKGITHKSHKRAPGTKETAQWTKMRYVDFPIPSTLDICMDKMLLISWELPIAILIRSKEIADNYHEYFNSVWEQAKP